MCLAVLSMSPPTSSATGLQITAMTIMKDHERLDLLKEIGGTKVYEERRKESLDVMKKTEGHRKRIAEVVSQLHISSFQRNGADLFERQ